MAGGHVNYRHLSRDSAARQALLRGLVTQLIHYEHIQTTYAKAKEAQRLAEYLISLGKRNTERTRRLAQGILYTPHLYLPKIFGEFRERYKDRAGGYTRVVRTEPKDFMDQGESAILELVDGRRDSRFMITAKAVARCRMTGVEPPPLTMRNVQKMTKFRGPGIFERMVKRFMSLKGAKIMPVKKDPEDADPEAYKREGMTMEDVEDADSAAYEKEVKQLSAKQKEKVRQIRAKLVDEQKTKQ